MKSTTKAAIALGILVGATASIHAAITPVNFAGFYTQNFDSLGSTGTSLSSIPEWGVYSLSGSHDLFAYSSSGLVTTTFLPWSTPTALNNGSGASTTTAQTTLTADTFASNTQAGVRAAGGFNFGSTVSPYLTTDRALGSSPTGTAATELQLSLINNTGTPLNALNISYDIRRFTTTTNNNNDAASDPYAGEEELPGFSLFYSLDLGANWNNVASLNPADLTGAPGTPTGPSVPNSVGVTNVPTTAVNLVSPWQSGSTLEVRWVDDNAESPSPDQNIGLDNVVVSVPEPTTLAMLGLAGAALLRRRRID